jgi:hypothetical protein
LDTDSKKTVSVFIVVSVTVSVAVVTSLWRRA